MRILKYFLWRLPNKILKSGFSLLNMETSETMAKRRRPLHTCGASILAIVHNASTKAQDFDEPLGSIAKRAVSFFDKWFPFIYTMLYQWLAVLSFLDDHILTVERAVEFVFPPSKHLFDKMDVLVCDAQVLPEKLDDILRRVTMIIHKMPFLDWVFGLFISRLHSILTLWGSKDVVTTEKEMSCNSVEEIKEAYSLQEEANNTPRYSMNLGTSFKRFELFYDDENSPMFKSAVSSPLPSLSREKSDVFGIKDTYKEILEKNGH